MDDKILELLHEMNLKLDSFGKKIDSLDSRFQGMEKSLESIHEKLDGIGYQFEEETKKRLKGENLVKALNNRVLEVEGEILSMKQS